MLKTRHALLSSYPYIIYVYTYYFKRNLCEDYESSIQWRNFRLDSYYCVGNSRRLSYAEKQENWPELSVPRFPISLASYKVATIRPLSLRPTQPFASSLSERHSLEFFQGGR